MDVSERTLRTTRSDGGGMSSSSSVAGGGGGRVGRGVTGGGVARRAEAMAELGRSPAIRVDVATGGVTFIGLEGRR